MIGAGGGVYADAAGDAASRRAKAVATEKKATAPALVVIPTCIALLATLLILFSFLMVELFTVRKNYGAR
jgi:hypothetical protein